ncbi:MAG TPA: hypothetical protein VIK83_04020 [Coriobacteriia bacterium]
MAQRSPYNDRYKTDQKGKTRRSASSSKPKRAIADLTPAQVAKASKKKPSIWSRAKASGSSGGSSSSSVPRIESSPRMKQLRRIWWWLWGGALAVAVIILVMQQLKVGNPVIIGGAWLIWLVSMAGAFYIEFVPIRRERNLVIEAMKSGGKGSKAKPPSQDGPA